MPNPVVHFEVVGRDASTLQGFYGEAFEWRIEPVVPGYAMVLPGEGVNGGIGAAVALEGGGGHVTFYVEVDDLDANLAGIDELGGDRVLGPVEVPNGPRLALFHDPERHLVGLIQAGTRKERTQE